MKQKTEYDWNMLKGIRWTLWDWLRTAMSDWHRSANSFFRFSVKECRWIKLHFYGRLVSLVDAWLKSDKANRNSLIECCSHSSCKMQLGFSNYKALVAALFRSRHLALPWAKTFSSNFLPISSCFVSNSFLRLSNNVLNLWHSATAWSINFWFSSLFIRPNSFCLCASW